MPASRTTKPKLPRKMPQSGKPPPSTPRRLCCLHPGCIWSFEKQHDLNRHSRKHLSPAERKAHEISCPHPGCPHTTLQRSNMNTHVRTAHTREAVLVCPDCEARFMDPAGLTMHRKQAHSYIPRRRSARAPVARRHSPYPALYPPTPSPGPSSSSSSASSPELALQSWAPSSTFAPSLAPASYDSAYIDDYEPTYPDLYYSEPAPAPTANWLDPAAFAAPYATGFDATCPTDFDTSSAFGAPRATDPDAEFFYHFLPFAQPVGRTPRPGTTAAYPAADLEFFRLLRQRATYAAPKGASTVSREGLRGGFDSTSKTPLSGPSKATEREGLSALGSAITRVLVAGRFRASRFPLSTLNGSRRPCRLSPLVASFGQLSGSV
ncbi:hypothetical protein B0H15DRAFT_988527 [Mycena belliarum]|uniref:C2H2-type domain-containing protein n=1 Tax=Mycena belliarum TaxID=1033014 RepID=A0AAD6XT60_9AGAR|nr:hypothetical protein B0H15DRAFT_988527 [Mycena belliae]